jgi:hypothetical protein
VIATCRQPVPLLYGLESLRAGCHFLTKNHVKHKHDKTLAASITAMGHTTHRTNGDRPLQREIKSLNERVQELDKHAVMLLKQNVEILEKGPQ